MLYEGGNPILRITDAAQLCIPFGSFTVRSREYAELLFLINGSITVSCREKEHAVKPGCILYLPQKLEYTVTYTDAEMISIHFITAANDCEPESYALYGFHMFQALFASVLGIWTGKNFDYQISSMSFLYRILCTICTRSHIPLNLKKAVAYIHANYRDSELKIDQICAHAGISPTRLREHFRNHFNESPKEYIIKLRLLYARTLIADGAPIETAAFESGFNDPKYFARVSKKYLNRTPSELKDTV